MQLIIHIDGASRGNPGPAAVGVVVADADTGKPIHEAGYALGEATNNVAEYRGLIRALEIAGQLKPDDVRVLSDSQLMVRQITGEYRVKSADLKPLLEQAQMLLLPLGSWQLRHVKREQNRRADELANMALDAGRDVILLSAIGETVTGGVGDIRRAASGKRKPTDAAHVRWQAWLVKPPGKKCPARTSGKTRYTFGPATPTGFCVHAAQAVFDESPTLWPEAGRTDSQTQCPLCGVAIEIELVDEA